MEKNASPFLFKAKFFILPFSCKILGSWRAATYLVAEDQLLNKKDERKNKCLLEKIGFTSSVAQPIKPINYFLALPTKKDLFDLYSLHIFVFFASIS